MRRPDGTWIKPPPTYEPIQTMCKYINSLYFVDFKLQETLPNNNNTFRLQKK